MDYIFIAEKRDIAKMLKKSLFKSVKKDTPIILEGILNNGKSGVVLIAQGHLLGFKNAWEIEKMSRDDFLKDKSRIPYLLKTEEIYKYYKVTDNDFGIKSSDRLKEFKKYIESSTSKTTFVAAVDPDDEGKSIFSEIMDYFKKNPYDDNCTYMNVGTIAEEAFEKNFKKLTPFKKEINAVNRAKARSLYDWTIGINLSSITYSKSGRLKTIICSIIAERDLERLAHKKGFNYYVDVEIDGKVFTHQEPCTDEKSAKDLMDKIIALKGLNISETITNEKNIAPPFHNEITLTAATSPKVSGDVSSIADKIRLQGLITYIRTKDTVVSPIARDHIAKISSRFDFISGYDKKLIGPVNKRYVGDPEKITHDGIHCTGNLKKSDGTKMTADESIIFEEVARRMLATMYPDLTYKKYSYGISNQNIDLSAFGYNYNIKENSGWTQIYPYGYPEMSKSPWAYPKKTTSFNVNMRKVETKPKPAYTETTLKKYLDNFARYIDDQEMKDLAKKANGIGTTATVGPTIKQLVDIGYLEQTGKSKKLTISDKGLELYRFLKKADVSLTNIIKTAYLEKDLTEIEKGNLTIKNFLKEVNNETSDMISKISNTKRAFTGSGDSKKEFNNAGAKTIGKCPFCGKDIGLSETKFGPLIFCNSCQYKFWGKVAEKKLTEKEIKTFLTKKKVALKGLTSKAGKKFDATLVLNEDKTTKFEFDKK